MRGHHQEHKDILLVLWPRTLVAGTLTVMHIENSAAQQVFISPTGNSKGKTNFNPTFDLDISNETISILSLASRPWLRCIHTHSCIVRRVAGLTLMRVTVREGGRERKQILCGTTAQMKINSRRKLKISAPNYAGTVDCYRLPAGSSSSGFFFSLTSVQKRAAPPRRLPTETRLNAKTE